MRWCTILEGVNQEAKLCHSTLWGETKHLEHLSLQFAIVNTQRTTTYFYTVTNEVVCLSTHLRWVGIEQRNIVRIRHSERMVG